MNVIHFDEQTKLVIAIMYNPENPQSEGVGVAYTSKEMTPINIGMGKEVNYYYDRDTDQLTYDVVDRPLLPSEETIMLKEQMHKLELDNANMMYALMMGGLI